MTRRFPAVAEQLAVFRRGAVDLNTERELCALLEEDRPLRIKFGMDPSSPDLHIGHSIPLLKLRDLQELGHRIVLVVGDATAMVGDPTGRNKLRPQLSRADVEANLVTYTEQAGKVLDLARTEVRRNSEWFDRFDFHDTLRLCSRMTVARMIERDTFAKRMAQDEPVYIHEFMYPLMQGWDSVELKSDVEFGGTDQLFNLLCGRDLQSAEGQRPQVCMTTPLINGLDGRKMSKSYGNAVCLTDSAREMTFAVMRLDDESMPTWFTSLTRLPEAEIAALLAGHPRDAKARLAHEITAFYHGAAEADEAAQAFDAQVRDKQLPDDVPEVAWPLKGASLPLANLLKELGLSSSTSDARRIVQQGGVRLDGEVARDPMAPVEPPAERMLLQAGKKRFVWVRGS